MLKPTQYHCFIQLDELYTELKSSMENMKHLKKIRTKALKSTCHRQVLFIIHFLFD
ncbi:YpoC family protein [Bacillus sp. SL00103]